MTESANVADKPMIVVDMGSKRKKQVKRLRKGQGRLMQRVNDTIEQLKQDEEIDAASQVVVVVVKQKKKRSRGLFG